MEENGYQIVLRGTNSSNNNNRSGAYSHGASFLYGFGFALGGCSAHQAHTHCDVCVRVYCKLHCTCECVGV